MTLLKVMLFLKLKEANPVQGLKISTGMDFRIFLLEEGWYRAVILKCHVRIS